MAAPPHPNPGPGLTARVGLQPFIKTGSYGMPPNEPKKPTFAEESMTNEQLAGRIRDLENTLAATRAGMPLSLIPEHAGGPGGNIAETWSQADQEAELAE